MFKLQLERMVFWRQFVVVLKGGGVRNFGFVIFKLVIVFGVEFKLVEVIENEIIDRSLVVKWDDIGENL